MLVMSTSTSWAILTPWPALALGTLWLTSNAHVRWIVRCQFKEPKLVGHATVGACVLALFALAATLTFATHAITNATFHPLKRFVWVIAILAASPLTLPLYWALHLRNSAQAH